MSKPLTDAAKRAAEHAFDGFVLTSGTPPERDRGVMLALFDKAGRSYATGVGETELEATNALVNDMTRRARQWIKMRRIVRRCRRALQLEADERRADASADFLASRKTKPSQP